MREHAVIGSASLVQVSRVISELPATMLCDHLTLFECVSDRTARDQYYFAFCFFEHSHRWFQVPRLALLDDNDTISLNQVAEGMAITSVQHSLMIARASSYMQQQIEWCMAMILSTH